MSDRAVAAPGVDTSPKLAALPVVLAVFTVGAQIAYPLTSGGARHTLTIVTVCSFFAASATHALVWRGVGFTARFVIVVVGIGFVAEAVGTRTGFPFGLYSYEGTLGPQAADVPLVIPLAWAMMAYPCLVAARRVTARPVPGIAFAALALTAWDVFLDPQMVAEGHWSWEAGGPLLGIPLTNFLGWAIVATLMCALVWPAMDPRGGDGLRGVDDRVPLVLFGWTYVGSIVAHLVFLDLPASGIAGAVAMGPFAAGLALALRRPPPVR